MGCVSARELSGAAADVSRCQWQGVTPGVPDICLPVARGGYHGLYIELKRLKGGRVEECQQWYLANLSRQGYKAVVCKGWEAARDVIEEYLAL